MDEQEIEETLLRAGSVAPRLSPDDIAALIVDEAYHVFPGTAHTVCCLTLRSGFTVLGSAACVCPENFQAEIGRMIARKNAREQLWALEGYLLRHKLNQARDSV